MKAKKIVFVVLSALSCYLVISHLQAFLAPLFILGNIVMALIGIRGGVNLLKDPPWEWPTTFLGWVGYGIAGLFFLGVGGLFFCIAVVNITYLGPFMICGLLIVFWGWLLGIIEFEQRSKKSAPDKKQDAL